MSEITDQVLAASGGLNYDDDPRMFQGGDTDYRLNVIPTALGSEFVLTNLKGTTKKTHSFSHHSDYDGAVYTSIGSCYDIKRNAIYYFVYSDLTNHSIIRYNINDDDFDKIVWENPNIGFDLDYPIVDAFMIDDWLYWNPRLTSPRSINVQWGYYNYIASPVTTTGGNWAVGDIAEFRSKIYRVTSVTLTETIPIGSEEYELISWSYADLNFSVRDRFYFNTVRNLRDKIGVTFTDNESVSFNKVWGKVFQFTYRMYVPDLGLSTSAPFTDVIADFDGEKFDGEYTGDVTRNNRIVLRIPLTPVEDDSNGRTDWLFDRIDVLFREGEGGEWLLLRSLTHDEAYNITAITGSQDYVSIDFYNDGNYGAVDNQAANVPYNYLPVLANSQTAIDGERVSYGRVTEGLGDISTDISFTAGVEEVSYLVERDTVTVDSYAITVNNSLTVYDGWNNPIRYAHQSENVSTAGVSNGDIIVTFINGVRYEGLVVDQSSVSSYIDDLIAVINKSSYHAINQTTKILVYTDNISTNIGIEVYASVSTLYDTYKLSTFKSGDHHPLCLFYYDHMGRMSNPVYTKAMRVYVPFLPEHYQQITAVADLGGAPNEVRITCASHGYSAGDSVQITDTTNYGNSLDPYTITNVNAANTFDIESAYTGESFGDASAVTSIISTNYRNNISWEIKHPPPDYAVQWGFGYAGRSSVGDFVQYNIYAVTLGTGVYSSYIALDIKPLQEITTNSGAVLDVSYPNSLVEAYVYSEGDRLRLITMKDASASGYDSLSIDNWTEYTRDYEIKYFDDATSIIYIDVEVARSTWLTRYNDNSVFIEIYHQKSIDDTLSFYEIGERYGVTETAGKKYHSGATQDQTDYDGSTPATGTLIKGDVYLITRAMSLTPAGFADNETLFLESASWSDFYDSEMWGKGKALADVGIAQKTLNNVRYSNKFNPLTGSSGIGQFDALDYLTLSYSYGNIVAMRQIGDVLSVLFANNVASVLVGATQMYNDDGTSIVLKSENILGSVNYSEDDYGCVNPESVLVVDRNLYFFDLTRKAYVRKAPNGMVAISGYKMKKYFIDKSDALLSSGTSYIQVRSTWDDDRGLLYVGFEDMLDADNTEVIFFHEASNRWVAFAELYATKAIYNGVEFPDVTDSNTDGPDVSIVNAIGSVNQVLTVVALETGSWSYPVEVGVTPTMNLKDGDSLYVSFEGTGDSFKAGAILRIDFSAEGPNDENITITEDTTIAITADCTVLLSLDFAADSASTDDEINLTIRVIVTRKSLPVFINSPSGVLGVVGEDVHLHNDNATRCNFFEVQKTYTTRIYGVEAPTIIKIFDSMAVHTNERWDVSDIQIPATLNYPNGMQSKIPSGRFEKEEGVLRSDYLCNQKTHQSTATIPDLLNGDNLRGYIIYHDLDGSETTEHTLFKVDILSTPSKY